MVLAAGLVAALAAAAGAHAAAPPPITLYSVATGVQYINTEDDRARGHTNNPLDAESLKLRPKSSGEGNGPFAGDIALYSIQLYSDAKLKKQAGSAVYTCFFNYDQHALCKAYYKVRGAGTVVASGPVDFKTAGFTIVVTGGTDAYLGARGEARVTPSPGNAQRIQLELIR